MTQNMHTFVATALSILTVQFIIQKRRFDEFKNMSEFELIIFYIEIIVPIIFLSAWFYILL